jgi:hypothetical protein
MKNLKSFDMGQVVDFCDHLKAIMARGNTAEAVALVERFEESIPKSYAQIMVIPIEQDGKEGVAVGVECHNISKDTALEGFSRGVDNLIDKCHVCHPKPKEDTAKSPT